jgi:hypothetical protein
MFPHVPPSSALDIISDGCMARTVFMIGHGNLALSQFVAVLELHTITKLIDIRTTASSHYCWFNHGFLQRNLPIGMYQHWPSLGGHRQFEPPAVKRALRQVLERADSGRLCLMCAEENYCVCPRHWLLTPMLIVVLVNLEMPDKLRIVILPSMPVRAYTFGTASGSFSIIPKPRCATV